MCIYIYIFIVDAFDATDCVCFFVTICRWLIIGPFRWPACLRASDTAWSNAWGSKRSSPWRRDQHRIQSQIRSCNSIRVWDTSDNYPHSDWIGGVWGTCSTTAWWRSYRRPPCTTPHRESSVSCRIRPTAAMRCHRLPTGQFLCNMIPMQTCIASATLDAGCSPGKTESAFDEPSEAYSGPPRP